MAETARQNSGLSTSCFPSPLLSFPVWLVGGGMPPWNRSWGWCGPFLPCEAMKSRFPPHTRNQRAGKAPLVRGAKCLSQPALGPENFPLELLSSCAYSGLVLCCCCCFQAVGTLQALFPAPRPPGTYPPVHDGMDFRVLPKKVSSDQPFLGAEVTIFYHREIYPLAMNVSKENHPCRISG